jgi:putative transposase
VIDTAIAELTRGGLDTTAACAVLGRARATHYRRHPVTPPRPRRAPVPHRERRQPAALSGPEREQVLAMLHSDRFADAAPAQVWATLLDEGTYLCSQRTMYRLLEREHGHVTDRRNQATHPPRVRPELVATRPNEVWSWDITKLKGPTKWTYYYLYVVIDIYSRYVVGWMLADREASELARTLFTETVKKEGIKRDRLTIHADRGSSMASKPVAFLLADLGITKSHSRPRVSNDNPYSESNFKTLKYCPAFPGSFGSITEARAFCADFFTTYNEHHRHSGIGLMTPAMVHTGQAEEIHAQRADVLRAALSAHPERFLRGTPKPPSLPEPSWINKPAEQTDETETAAS